MTILILGGTRNAIRICEKLNADVIYSLAGVTKNPNVPNNAQIISGGFGGAIGLQTFLTENKISCVIDATHPYATIIKNNARVACESVGVKLIGYQRIHWKKQSDSDWIEVDSVAEIVAKLGSVTGDIFVALGAKDIDQFSCLSGRVVARMIENKDIPNVTKILGEIPKTIAQENTVFEAYDFQAIVCKNSGTKSGYFKIALAKEKDIPVYMLKCPVNPIVNVYCTIEDVIKNI